MKSILIFNWKDIKHPQAGGAEVVTHEIAKRAVQDGIQVMMITARPQGLASEEVIDGVRIVRRGNRVFHYFQAYWYYIRQVYKKGQDYDALVEEVNTIPYFLGFLLPKKARAKVFLFYHQLAREVWFFQLPRPLSWIGYYCAEPVYTWLQGWLKKTTITVSKSTHDDLVRHGFRKQDIHIIREGISSSPLSALDFQKKEKKFTVLFHSALREMKRPDHAIKAFCIFALGLNASERENVQMWVSGDGPLRNQCEEIAKEYGMIDNITFFGRTSNTQMRDIMTRASVLVSTSVKEGWGLIVSEANSFGTPAVSYDVDGLRDSTACGQGRLVDPNPEALAEELHALKKIFDTDSKQYQKWCTTAWESSKDITFENCYSDFKNILEQNLHKS